MELLIEGPTIREVSPNPINATNAQVIDIRGKTLMPGLIDAHVHAYASDVNFQKVDFAGAPYRTAHAVRMLGFALECGFTTVRDVGGGGWSLSRAIDDRLVRAPRFLYAGKILSMTGGHGDFRQVRESRHRHGYCSCGDFNTLSVVGGRGRGMYKGGPRGTAPWCALHHDHGLRRCGFSNRPHLDESVSRG